MTALQRLIPLPHLLEIDRVDVPAPAAEVWDSLRHGELTRSIPIRTLFWLRSLASLKSAGDQVSIRIDTLRSSREHPGFQVLVDEPPHELAVGAIGKVWQLDIPFVHVGDDQAYSAFSQPGFIKVAWAIRVLPRGAERCHVELEVRVAATDADSWRKFRRYFRVVGPFSRFIRHSLLRALARQMTASDAQAGRQAA